MEYDFSDARQHSTTVLVGTSPTREEDWDIVRVMDRTIVSGDLKAHREKLDAMVAIEVLKKLFKMALCGDICRLLNDRERGDHDGKNINGRDIEVCGGIL